MKLSGFIFCALSCLFVFNAGAQISGNQVYRASSHRENGGQPDGRVAVEVNGSELTISTSILLNAKPDVMLVTLGVNQEAKTVKDCNVSINSRIDGFKQRMKTIGVKGGDIYIDFISQNRVYDYDVSNSNAVQVQAGFEIKKNLIVRLTDVNKFEELTRIASDYEIFDIVKADYINEDVDAVYSRLFDEALKSNNAKKLKYCNAFKLQVSDDFNMVNDNYYSVQPKTQYKEYKAFESSEVSVYNDNRINNYVKEEKRKSNTYYYEGVDTSSFDKVINPSNAEIGIQYVVEMKIVYHIKR
jgi:uncharacterized protein YggE